MVYIASRMQARPTACRPPSRRSTRSSATTSPAAAWTTRWPASGSRSCCTLFLFIWFSNLIGYIPLPTNSHETIDIAGLEIPAFAIYAATANISIPLVLALVVFVSFNVEGIRAKGFVGYLKSLIPEGVSGAGASRSSSSSSCRTSCACSRSPYVSSPTSSPAT